MRVTIRCRGMMDIEDMKEFLCSAEPLEFEGTRALRIEECNGEIMVKIRHGKEKEIRIIPVSKLLRKPGSTFREEGLLKKSFQGPRLRGIQYLVKGISQKEEENGVVFLPSRNLRLLHSEIAGLSASTALVCDSLATDLFSRCNA